MDASVNQSVIRRSPIADWRMRQAVAMIKGDMPRSARRWVDDLVNRVFRFFKGDPDPEIEAVIDLRCDDQVLDRAEITARILANQPASDIAVAVGRPVGFIQLYERVMFDVREYGSQPPGVPGLDIFLPIDEKDVEAVLNRVAVHDGLDAVEAILKDMRAGLHAVLSLETATDVSDDQEAMLEEYRKLIRPLIEPVDLHAWVLRTLEEARGRKPVWDWPPP